MTPILKPRIKSFTIMEILVTMIISGIVVLTAFQFYSIFNMIMLQKTKLMDERNVILQFYDVLKSDISKAERMKYSINKLVINSNQEEVILYNFSDEYVVRNVNNLTDTFRVHLTEYEIDKDIVTGFEKILKFEIKGSIGSYPVLLEKTYTNDILLNTTYISNKQINVN
jgi:hypothetical protein